MTSPIRVFVNPIFAMTSVYGIASRIGGNMYVVTNARDMIFPNFGKNLTIPYAASDEITIAITVVQKAMIRLFEIFFVNPSVSMTFLKWSNVNSVGKMEVGLDVRSLADFTEQRSTQSNGNTAMTDKTIRYKWQKASPIFSFRFPVIYLSSFSHLPMILKYMKHTVRRNASRSTVTADERPSSFVPQPMLYA